MSEIKHSKPLREDTIIIAANDSKDKNRADYVCAGLSDEAIINTAITLLSRGGKIILLDGTFQIGASINLTNDITIQGQGISTIIKVQANAGDINGIYGSGATDNILRDFKYDSNSANQSGDPMGVYFEAASNNNLFENIYWTTSKWYTIYCEASENVVFRNCQFIGDADEYDVCIYVCSASHYFVLDSCYFEGVGVYAEHVLLLSSEKCTIQHCVFNCAATEDSTIFYLDVCHDLNFYGNIFINYGQTVSDGYIVATSTQPDRARIINNYFENISGYVWGYSIYDSVIANNICMSTPEYFIDSVSRTVITNNLIIGCHGGYYSPLNNIYQDNTVTNNYIQGVSRDAIQCVKNNVVTGNRIKGILWTSGNCIRVTGSGNVITENILDAKTGGSGYYDIYLTNKAGNQIIAGNILKGGYSGYILDSGGASSRIFGNLGYYTSGYI